MSSEKQDGKKDKDSSGLSTLVEAEKWLQIAILLPAAAFIGWLIGAWLAHKFHQDWMETAGVTLGGLAGIVHVVRLVLATGDKE